MTDHPQSTPYYARRMYRALTGIVGLGLASLGIYAIGFAGPSTSWQLLGGAVLVLAGVNMVFSAYRARESWLSRIGPLP
jgi:uncharacterized membrane protein HdeD (DUF308 family)